MSRDRRLAASPRPPKSRRRQARRLVEPPESPFIGKDPIRGAKVQIEQMPSIDDARAKESRVIKRSQPPQNKQRK